MYKGFNLAFSFKNEEYFKIGNALYEENKTKIRTTLDNFITTSGSVNASAMQESWFPQLDFDVFLSHSHQDKILAITLGGLLSKLGLKVFIDSCIWGHADELLKQIDNAYCYNKDSNTYDYEKRNISTSHVHMMLSVALTMLIDKSECLFFLNTPNSINSLDILLRTESPWLYAEISIARLVRQKKLQEYRKEIIKGRTELKTFNENFNFEYDVPLGHLQDLSQEDFVAWIKTITIEDTYHLDKLYNLKSKVKLL